MLIKNAILALIGLSGGIVIAGGIFAFVTIIGIIPRLASRTGTAKYILLYEDCIMVGGILGNLISIFEFGVPVGLVGLVLFGLFAGTFVGCLAMALAETINVFPIMTGRIKLVYGMPFLVLAVAIGKGLGSFYQMVIR